MWVAMVLELTDSDTHVKGTCICEFKNNWLIEVLLFPRTLRF